MRLNANIISALDDGLHVEREDFVQTRTHSNNEKSIRRNREAKIKALALKALASGEEDEVSQNGHDVKPCGVVDVENRAR